MMVIGLTGGIASGKSTVAAMLENANIPVIDADHLAKELTKSEAVLKEIAAHFLGVLNTDGSLNRAKLAEIVFSNPEKLKELEAILHPKIEELRMKILAQLKSQGHKFAIYMAPLIFEKGLEKKLDGCILVTADQDLVIKRTKERDGMSEAEVKKRIKAQMSDAQKRALADVVIENNGSLLELQQKLSMALKNFGIELFL